LASGEAEDEGVTEIASMQKARSDRGKHRKASAAEQARLKEIEAFEFDGKDG